MTLTIRAHRFVLDLSPRLREEVEKMARGRRDAYNFALALDRDTYAADPLPADWADYELDWTPPEWSDARRIETWAMNKVWAKAWPALIPEHAAPGQPCQLAIADMRLAVIAAAKRKGGLPPLPLPLRLPPDRLVRPGHRGRGRHDQGPEHQDAPPSRGLDPATALVPCPRRGHDPEGHPLS